MALYAGLTLHLVDSRAVPSARAVSSKFADCTPTFENVNFHDLMETFSAFHTNKSHTNPKRAIFRLQMFTPLPLHHLACFSQRSSLCDTLATATIQEISDKMFAKIWTGVYPSRQPVQPKKKACSNNSTTPEVLSSTCTTDLTRFPPVLCEASCHSPCDCCRQRAKDENNNRRVKKKVHYMRIKSCANGQPEWELQSRMMLPLSPNSCVCRS